jgi:hypothetical protein
MHFCFHSTCVSLVLPSFANIEVGVPAHHQRAMKRQDVLPGAAAYAALMQALAAIGQIDAGVTGKVICCDSKLMPTEWFECVGHAVLDL